MSGKGENRSGDEHMRAEKRDRRVKYTRTRLRDGLVTLLQQKPIEKISVKEICEAADVNRSTFYSHYSDQYHLFQQTQQEVLQDLNDYLADYNFTGREADLHQILKRVFEYIAANAALCKVLLGENGDQTLQQALVQMVRNQSLKVWPGAACLNPQMVEHILLFHISGSVGLVKHWLQSSMKECASEMADVLIKLTYRGLCAFR